MWSYSKVLKFNLGGCIVKLKCQFLTNTRMKMYDWLSIEKYSRVGNMHGHSKWGMLLVVLFSYFLWNIWLLISEHWLLNALTGGNWQKWKRVFLTCPCHNIYRDEAVGLKSCKNTWKITIFVKMWNLGQYRENLIFCR